MLGEAIMRDRGDPVRGFLLIPPDRDPGTVFAYSCSLPGRTAEAVWRHPPLNSSKLQHLHCPG
jgi:hypothetical protein